LITALDTNVLVDVLRADTEFGRSSIAALGLAADRGSLVACDVVWSEVSSAFDHLDEGRRILEHFGVAFSAMSSASAERAGRSWRAYRRAGGPRERMIADFLIAAHAHEQAEALLTRDRGFTRAYFGELTVIDPTAEG